MPDYRAIADVGETLVELLRDKIFEITHQIPKESIVLASPGEIEEKDNVRLSLFLYQILVNPHLRNQEMQIKDHSTLKFPPVALDLYYMLTSYPSATPDLTDRTKEEHNMLGMAIQILNDNSVLAGSVLKGSLAVNSDDLRITLNPVSLDEMTKMWTAFPGKPFRSSFCFLVTPVSIDSNRKLGVQRVLSKDSNYDNTVLKGEGE